MTYIQHQRKPRLVTVFLADSLITVCGNFPAFIFVMQIIRNLIKKISFAVKEDKLSADFK